MSALNPEAPYNFFPDDFEVETSALSSEECSAAGQIVLPLHWMLSDGRLQRLALTASMLGLSLLVVLSLIFTQAASTPAMMIGPHPGSAALLKANAAPLPLGAAPPYCLRRPTPRPIFPNIRPVIGAAPVWVAGFDGRQATLHIPDPGLMPPTPYGWEASVLWEVGPAAPGAVVVRGNDLRSGAPLWFGLPNQAATTLLILNPGAPHAVSPLGKGWADWQGELYISSASCYVLETSWPGGWWRMIFAAGRGAEPTPIISPDWHCRGQEVHCVPPGP